MELIKATIEDIQTLLEIEKTAKGLKVYSGYFSEKELEEWINSEVVYLIKNNDIIIGSISYKIESVDHADISGLVIKPEFQKRGFAKRAIILLLEELKDFKRLTLVVHPDNHAIRLYESFGFIQESRKENYWGDGEPRLMMVKNQ
jgi:ribosomal-protein-alanine N-acetyltransferase